MKLQLQNGMITEIDDEDYDKISGITWRAQKAYKDNWYVVGALRGFKLKSGSQKIVKLHRVVMGATDRSQEVDHRDHNTLNNKKSNLRICTKSQNQCNRAGVASHKNGSDYVGVFVRPWKNGIRNSYRAGLRVNRRWITIGTFHDEKSAAIAYNEAASKHFGEFACLNKIE